MLKKPSDSKTAQSANAAPSKGLSWKWPAAAAATVLGALAIGVPSFLKSEKPIETVSVARAVSVAPATKTLPNEETNPAAGSTTINVATVQPAIEQVAVATTELNSTAKDLSGSVRNIDANTQQIAETLEQLRNSFATASNGGQIIANPQTIGEIYSNARTYAKQGKYKLARDSYTELMSKDVPFVDVHKNFQRLLVVQEGAARARDLYANLSQANTTVEFAKTLLLSKAERRDALAKFVTENQEFGPAIFELTHCVANDKSGNKTLTEKQWEAKLLQEFLSLHDKGEVLRHYLDQTEAAAAIEEASNRLEQLEARPTTQSDVNLSFRYARHGMMVLVQIPEKCKSIWYSTDGEDYKSTGESIGIDQATGQPLPRTNFLIRESKKSRSKSVFVKYTDIRDTEHGPFEYPLDWEGQKKDGIRRMVDKTRHSWVKFLESNGKTRLYFTALHQFQDCIEEVQYGFNVDEPDQTYQLAESQTHMLPVADDVQSVVIRLKFKDGTQSDIERFDR